MSISRFICVTVLNTICIFLSRIVSKRRNLLKVFDQLLWWLYQIWPILSVVPAAGKKQSPWFMDIPMLYLYMWKYLWICVAICKYNEWGTILSSGFRIHEAHQVTRFNWEFTYKADEKALFPFNSHRLWLKDQCDKKKKTIAYYWHILCY